jgi:hypothetical protein
MEDNAIYTESNERDNEAAIEEDVESKILRGSYTQKLFIFKNGSGKVGGLLYAGKYGNYIWLSLQKRNSR